MSSSTTAPRFGLFTLAAVVVANMVGAGIFTTSGFSLADLGTPERVMWAWLIGGLIALTGAVSYGMLSRRMAESGGEYLYLSKTIHPLAGFIAGWVSLLAGFTGAIAFAATALESYLVPPEVRPDWLAPDTVAIAAVIIGGLMHGIRAKSGALWQNIAVVLKVLILAAFALFAAYLLVSGGWPADGGTGGEAPPFSVSTFAMSLVWISLSFSGFNAAVYMAGEAKEPKKTVPRALLLGTLAVTVIYLALNAIFVYAPPHSAVAGAEDVAAVAARTLGGESFMVAARLTIALALFTSVSSMVMAGPRVYARMAEDRLMPQLFEFNGRVPRAAIAFQVVLATVFILVSGLQDLLSYLGFTLSLSAAAAVSGLFVVHWREGEAPATSRAYPWVPAIFVVATVGLAILAARQNPAEITATVLTVVTGTILYWIIKIRQGGEPAKPGET